MKKSTIIIILILLIPIVMLLFYFTIGTSSQNHVRNLNYCSDENGKKIDCAKCLKKGKVFEHGMGNTCEIKAKDAGKDCAFDNECDKDYCVYENENSTSGKCDDYVGDNEGGSYHRPESSNKPVYKNVFS